MNLPGWQRLPVLLQTERLECGLTCLAMISAAFGRYLDVRELRTASGGQACDLASLMRIARSHGLHCRALRGEPADLKRLRTPAMLHWNLDHFVVLAGTNRTGVLLHDPAVGRRRVPWAEVERRFTGVVLEVQRGDGFAVRQRAERLTMGDLWRSVGGLGRPLSAVLCLSLLLQLIALATPLQVQFSVDEAITRGDTELMTVLAVAFALLLLVRVVTELLRGRLAIWLGQMLSFTFATRFNAHLVRLPVAWFERRHLGDVVSRFASLKPLEDVLSHGVAAALVDGLMAFGTLFMMLVYAPVLALVVLTAVCVYGLVRLLQYRGLHDATAAQVSAHAREESTFLETARAIATVRCHGIEQQRMDLWQSRHLRSLHSGASVARRGLVGDVSRTCVFGTEAVVVVWLAGGSVLAGELSVGMLFAFLSFKAQFAANAGALIDQLLQVKLTRVHLDRLGDVVFSAAESGPAGCPERLAGTLCLDRVSFGYAPGVPVLRDVELSIPSGAFVAVVGPSGGGKSTLLRLLLGLLRPDQGRYTIAGIASDAAVHRLRASLGVVLQDDGLFAGSVLDNITLFEGDFDDERLAEVSSWAGVASFVSELPLGYETPVGDLGSPLSGGQVQRLLLARALYRQPAFLFLDEGTANLDPGMRAVVHERLRRLDITRVVVTHDLTLARMADRILRVEHGRVAEIPRTELPSELQ